MRGAEAQDVEEAEGLEEAQQHLQEVGEGEAVEGMKVEELEVEIGKHPRNCISMW